MIQAMADGGVKMGLPRYVMVLTILPLCCVRYVMVLTTLPLCCVSGVCYVMVLTTLPLCCISGIRYDTGDG